MPSDLTILWQDQGVWAVDKPHSLPVHQTLDWQRPHLHKRLARQLDLPMEQLVVLHRLDVDTSGLVLVARHGQHEAWQQRLALPETAKVYLALTGPLVPGVPADHAWYERHHLRSVRDGNKERMVPVRAGGDRAESWMQVVASSDQAALVQVRLKTGRRHQIRAQLAALGMPLVGDAWYGSPLPAERVMLHAAFLRLASADAQPPQWIASPPPEDWLQTAAHLGLVLEPDHLQPAAALLDPAGLALRGAVPAP